MDNNNIDNNIDNNNIDTLYDHYKDSFGLQKESLKKRNLYTYALLAIIFVFSFQQQERMNFEFIVDNLIKDKIGVVKIRITYVNTIINVVYLLLMMSYYQISLNIERLYTYIHKLENTLSQQGCKIEREGCNYLNLYPWMLWLVHRVYQWGLPIGLIVVSFLQINEFYEINLGLYKVINILLFSFSIIISLLYISYIHLHEEYFDKQKWPDIIWYKRLLYYFIGHNN